MSKPTTQQLLMEMWNDLIWWFVRWANQYGFDPVGACRQVLAEYLRSAAHSV